MDRFSPKHFLFLILATAIVSLKTYPTIFIRDVGRDSWVGMIAASMIIFVFFTYIISIWKKHNNYSLTKIYETALGKKLGKLFIYMFIFSLFVTLVESAAAESNSMHTNMLNETPQWYLLIFFIGPALYTVRKDLVAVISVTIIGIVLIMIAGINLGILTAKYKKFQLLFPIFQNGITSGFFISTTKMLGLYGCVSISLPYLSKIFDSKKMIKYTIIGLIILIQMQIVSVTGLIMTFGPQRVDVMNYPKLLQTQLVSYMRFLEFGELYVMLQILGGWLLKYLITFYGLLILLRELNIKRKAVIYLSYILSVLVFIFSYALSNNLFILFDFFNVYSYFCLINFVIIPLFVFILFNKKTKGS